MVKSYDSPTIPTFGHTHMCGSSLTSYTIFSKARGGGEFMETLCKKDTHKSVGYSLVRYKPTEQHSTQTVRGDTRSPYDTGTVV